MHNIFDSCLMYNGVEVPFIKVERFQQEPIWSPDKMSENAKMQLGMV